jgi:hypothetical protein
VFAVASAITWAIYSHVSSVKVGSHLYGKAGMSAGKVLLHLSVKLGPNVRDVYGGRAIVHISANCGGISTVYNWLPGAVSGPSIHIKRH